jgi:hypothetical protein
MGACGVAGGDGGFGRMRCWGLPCAAASLPWAVTGVPRLYLTCIVVLLLYCLQVCVHACQAVALPLRAR